MLAPLVIVCLVAFTPENTLSIPGHRASRCAGSARCSSTPDLMHSFWNSLGSRPSSATLSVALAVPAGIAIARYDFPGRDALNGLLLSPLIVPHLVLGVAMLRLFALIGARGSSRWLALAHVVIVTPYALRLVVAALAGLDRSAEQAALSLGASHLTVFRRITLPLMLPGITGGWMLAFINSFDEVTMSIFVTSPQTVTLPVRMYMYRHRVDRSDDGRGLGADGGADGARDDGARPRSTGSTRCWWGSIERPPCRSLHAPRRRRGRADEIAFMLDGRACTALEGDTVLTAVLTHGRALREQRIQRRAARRLLPDGRLPGLLGADRRAASACAPAPRCIVPGMRCARPEARR